MFNEVKITTSPSNNILEVTFNASLLCWTSQHVRSVAKTVTKKLGLMQNSRVLHRRACAFSDGILLTFVGWMWSRGTEVVG